MIFYRRRQPFTTVQAPGQLPPTKVLWRNTAIAWGVFVWGLIFWCSLKEMFSNDQFINTSTPFSWAWVVAIAPHFSRTLLFALIQVSLVCGAFFGSVLLLTSIITTMHRSWRVDESARQADSSSPPPQS